MDKAKERLIEEIKSALEKGVLQPDDLRAILHINAPTTQSSSTTHDPRQKSPIGAVFYNIAGILLFAVLLSIVFQTSGDEYYFLHVILTTGAGLFMWVMVALLQRRDAQESDVMNGLKGALLVTGLLSVLAGVFVMTAHSLYDSGSDNSFYLVFAAYLALAVVFHLAADVAIKSALLLNAAVLFSVMTLGFIAAQLLSEADAGLDAWVVTVILTGAWLASQTRLLARSVYRGRLEAIAFDGLAIWLALLAAYFGSFGEFGILWLVGLALAVFGIFYLSVVKQKRYFLGTAAFFLVLTLVTISFKYFSDFGITVSLFLSLVAVMGSAYVTSLLNKRYFKQAD